MALAKRVYVLYDKSSSSWYKYGSIFIKVLLERIAESDKYREARIRLYYFQRDKVVDIGEYPGFILSKERIENIVAAQYDDTPGSMPMCALKKFLEILPHTENIAVIIVSDFRTTVRITQDKECAREASNIIKELATKHNMWFYFIIVPSVTRGSIEPFGNFIKEIGGIIGVTRDEIIMFGSDLSNIRFYRIGNHHNSEYIRIYTVNTVNQVLDDILQDQRY